MSSRSNLLLLLALVCAFSLKTTNSFTPSFQYKAHVTTTCSSCVVTKQQQRNQISRLNLSDGNDQDDKLAKLGFSEDEIRRSRMESTEKEEVNVNVNVVEDVDPFTLTAVGFGLIALNFFVFANVGDGGIAGLVATVINTMRQ